MLWIDLECLFMDVLFSYVFLRLKENEDMVECFFGEKEIIMLDLHNMRTWEAALALDNAIENADSAVREIVVIHGYHQGNELQNMVRKDYRNRKIANKFIGLNQGRTSLILKR
ncbi:MAG: hypothetical protein WBI07_19875 [Mobilitalea sp.]